MADRRPIMLAAVSLAAVFLTPVALMRAAEAADMSATPQSAEPDLPTKKLTVPVTTAAAPTGDNGRLGPAAVRPGSNIWPRAWSGTEDKALTSFFSAARKAASGSFTNELEPSIESTPADATSASTLSGSAASARSNKLRARTILSGALPLLSQARP